MLWRKPDEGLLMYAKEKKVGSGCKVAAFFMGIACNREVVFCEQMPNRKITGEFFGNMVRSKFPGAFEKMNNPDKRLVLQDGCPSSSKQCKGCKGRPRNLGVTIGPLPHHFPIF